jgi:hypothetical protein
MNSRIWWTVAACGVLALALGPRAAQSAFAPVIASSANRHTSSTFSNAQTIVTFRADATQTALAQAQTLVQPQSRLGGPMVCTQCCGLGLHVDPKNSTIPVNQQATLYDKFKVDEGGLGCHSYKVDATWRSSGGSLQVLDGGTGVIFTASSPGVYTIVATYGRQTGKAHVTVTPM